MSTSFYSGEYDATKLNNGNPDEIKFVFSLFSHFHYPDFCDYTCNVEFITEYVHFKNEYSILGSWKKCCDCLIPSVFEFLNDVTEDLTKYLKCPKGYLVRIIQQQLHFDCGKILDISIVLPSLSSLKIAKDKEKKEEEEKRKQEEEQQRKKEKIERENGWFELSLNNIDMRLPESNLTKEQQLKIANICNSKMIVLFEDFDDRYGMMYFELQPSSYSESVRFGFKQLSSQEKYETVRDSKECRKSALRALFPIVDAIIQKCEAIEEDKLFDLIDGKIERICFHSKNEKIDANLSIEGQNQNINGSSEIILQPIQLSIPKNAKKCSLTEGKDGNYTDYKAYIECSFDTGKSVKYVYYQNSLTDDVDNYWQCPVPKDKRRTAKGDIITVLKDAGFFADFEIIEKFKAKNL